MIPLIKIPKFEKISKLLRYPSLKNFEFGQNFEMTTMSIIKKPNWDKIKK